MGRIKKKMPPWKRDACPFISWRETSFCKYVLEPTFCQARHFPVWFQWQGCVVPALESGTQTSNSPVAIYHFPFQSHGTFKHCVMLLYGSNLRPFCFSILFQERRWPHHNPVNLQWTHHLLIGFICSRLHYHCLLYQARIEAALSLETILLR